ncbi:DASH family cryptochrome [Cryomorpha ignava]|uniref:Cryptochrome DASH n=1 Tax=Cryomorpha ignava TaxID=101383 RepID=A0A7K3WMZ8_9FLAO|nr:DASH family cryptochrome [Cryomorpha ignava]NEN22075.1 DASH family cryptochrome [Cryomorpha ignava]
MRRAIVLFRNDLRFEDHEPMRKAAENFNEIIPVYIFDREWLKGEAFSSNRLGYHRLKFILEALSDLNQSFVNAGGKLHVLIGKPLDELLKIIDDYHPSSIYLHKEIGPEEIKFEESLEHNLPVEVKIIYSWNQTLVHINDLPFKLNDLPHVFTDFRKIIEKQWYVRDVIKTPEDIVLCEGLNGEIPTLAQLGFEEVPQSEFTTFTFEGGESAGSKRIENYLWESHHILDYKQTRNQLLGENYSSKFSPYLAQGCVSPRKIYCEIKKFENEIEANDATYWLIFELLWRDFFKFVAFKYGKKLFAKAGTNERKPDVKPDTAKAEAWKQGKTGIPFIDANMRELNETGFMSNRGRQNVAGFFVDDLKQDWREGAAYFEQRLIDYDMASNWGNWAYLAGVGNDPRPNRHFNVISQAKRYDPIGEFVKRWLPELKGLIEEDVHEPWKLSADKRIINKLENSIYTHPIFISPTW